MHAIKNPNQLQKSDESYPSPTDSTVAFAMCKAVPDIVDEVGDSAHLYIDYGSLHIENGMTLSPDQLLDEPEVSIKGDGTYTLMMVDIDPAKSFHKSWLHWLVINIPSTDIKRGEVVEPYMAPEPQAKKHRYLFLLFKQSGRVKARKPAKRQGFQVKEFAKEHDMGNPANGLFFWAASDEQ